LHSVSSEQLQKLADLAEIELPPCMKVIQDPRTEGQDDIDNELKWKQERLLMQEQAEGFIRRMHLIQGK
jgi:hypothetical protein